MGPTLQLLQASGHKARTLARSARSHRYAASLRVESIRVHEYMPFHMAVDQKTVLSRARPLTPCYIPPLSRLVVTYPCRKCLVRICPTKKIWPQRYLPQVWKLCCKPMLQNGRPSLLHNLCFKFASILYVQKDAPTPSHGFGPFELVGYMSLSSRL